MPPESPSSDDSAGGLRLLPADLRSGMPSGGVGSGVRAALTVRFLAVALFRLSQSAGRRFGLAGTLVKQLNHLITGADIAWQASIGPGLQTYHPTGVVIGPYVRLGADARLQQGITLGGDGGPEAGRTSSPTIGRGARIGPGARVFGSIRLGDDVTVGANAVVVCDVSDGATVVGIPARPVTSAR